MNNRTVIAAFALALAAGVSHAALAQDGADNRPHGPHGEHMDGRGAAPQAAPAQQGSAPQSFPAPPQGGQREGFRQHDREPAPAVGAQPAPAYRNDRGPGPARTDGNRGDGYRVDPRSEGYRGGDRRDEANRGARPPQDRGHDGYRNDDHWDRGDRADGDRRWERGRYPPVYQSQQRFRINPYRYPQGWYARSWAFGDLLPRGWYGSDYRLGDFYAYGLPYPPPGYEWVRVGPDALMIDRYSGRVVQVVRYVFW